MADVDILVGIIGRAHGLRGEVSVHVRTDEPDRRFAPGARLRVGDSDAVVAAARWHSGHLLVRLAGVDDRTAAEALRGSQVWARVPADEPPAGEDEYYDRHLVGLAVRDHTGAEVGTIRDVLHPPAHDTLVVATASGERLVPFVAALVPVVDLDAGFVAVAEVGGLLADEDA